MGLQRVTITAWPSALTDPRGSEGVRRWATSPGGREAAEVSVHGAESYSEVF